MFILYNIVPLLALLELSGAVPLASYQNLAARADLSCPASNGATYTTGGKSYVVECNTDRSGCVLVNYVTSDTACYLKSTANDKSSNSGVWGALAAATLSSSVKPTSKSKATSTSRAASISVPSTTLSVIQAAATSATAGKRGLAYNDASLTKLFSSSGSKISWTYNWGSSSYGASTAYEYVPLLHDNGTSHTSVWAANVKTAVAAGAGHAMSFNEPDQCGVNSGGACMQDIKTTVANYKTWMQPLSSNYGSKLKLGAPAVTNGVLDTTTGSPMGLPWLQQFIGNCTSCQIDFVAIHWYDSPSNVAYFKSHVQDAYAAGGNRPVWITEFAPTSGTDADKQTFLKAVLPWLDSLSYVERYAYQMDARGELVTSDGTALSPLGQVYNTA
ncbi:glycoside hydrolase family 128 protein [Lepidopterella palustris CBS 459.81]|uniref:Glycoside hydrolase family 128 protein n=1 Tax=Lepidopterella palustris CBS 459.81 TaxID=1314670 RepID=A0A8E2E2W5_9PEZI|nr:glycoside hydrolase family 128 protein [Lepidopterella palustris CBS 459.81]